MNDLLQLTSEDVVLGGLPLSHSFGQTAGLNAAVRAGACLVLLATFDAEAALATLRDRRVTVMEGEPTMYDGMLRHPEHADLDLSRLRRLRLGWRRDAGGGAPRVRGGVPLPGPRGLRARGGVARGQLQPDWTGAGSARSACP